MPLFSIKKSVLFVLLLGSIFLLSFYTYTLFKYVPSDFPSNSRFVIAENETLKSVSVRLKEEKYITSDLFFRALISSAGKDRMLKAGGYSFNEPLNLLNVVKKFSFGKPDVPLLSITIPEGSTVDEIAESVHKVIPTISVDSFLRFVEETKVHGKLFPSTYFLSPSSTAEGIIKIMKNTFENKYMHFVQEVSLPSPLSSHEEVLSLAAILEGEAKTKEDMQMVAGILLSRLQKGMLLQVDVATSTYTIKGLPTVPINNPGEISILAVFNATPSPYLYYLTGKDGKMYYAKTFEEHKRNIQKYLR